MFYITAFICMLQINALPVPVCFADASIPYSFKTENECLEKRDNLIELIDQELKDRKMSMVFYCKQIGNFEETNV